jgi:hypothetical protein
MKYGHSVNGVTSYISSNLYSSASHVRHTNKKGVITMETIIKFALIGLIAYAFYSAVMLFI